MSDETESVEQLLQRQYDEVAAMATDYAARLDAAEARTNALEAELARRPSDRDTLRVMLERTAGVEILATDDPRVIWVDAGEREELVFEHDETGTLTAIAIVH